MTGIRSKKRVDDAGFRFTGGTEKGRARGCPTLHPRGAQRRRVLDGLPRCCGELWLGFCVRLEFFGVLLGGWVGFFTSLSRKNSNNRVP